MDQTFQYFNLSSYSNAVQFFQMLRVCIYIHILNPSLSRKVYKEIEYINGMLKGIFINFGLKMGT